MVEIRYTLLADGSSDRALLPILSWALHQQGMSLVVQPAWADLGRLRRRPRTLADRIIAAMQLYPCDLLFVHRDAEREAFEFRRSEIVRALDEIARQEPIPLAAICVVPVRMQEAWLLFDEMAIRTAAGNPRGRQQLPLPLLWRPCRPPVFFSVISEAGESSTFDIDEKDIDVPVALQSESDRFPIRRPCRGTLCFTRIDQETEIATICIHDIDAPFATSI